MVSEDGRLWVRTAGGTQTAGISKGGGARVDKVRGTIGDSWGWVMTAGDGS